MTILTVHVVEIGMAAPDIVCVIVRDQDPEIGQLLELTTPDSAAYGSAQLRDPVTGGTGTEVAKIVGQKNAVLKKFLKFADKIPTVWLNRATVDNPANWATIGGRTVTNVWRKSRVFGQINNFATGSGVPALPNTSSSTMEHYIYAKLNGNLAQGTYTVSVTGNPFPATSFVWNDRSARSHGLRVSQTGYRAAEKSKTAYLSMWIPGYGTEGRVNYATTYALTTAELIDVNGVTVFTGALTLFVDATTPDPGGSTPAYLNVNYASSTIAPKLATAVSSAAGVTTITCANHGFSNGQTKCLQGFGQFNASGNNALGIDGMRVISNVTTNTFTIPLTSGTWLQGAFLPGYDSLIFDTFSANRWMTNVYSFDFSGFDASKCPGKYRVRVAGLGVSDEFTLMPHTRYADASIYFKGVYNQFTGMALDPAVGNWNKSAQFVDGVNGVEIYEGRCPAALTFEAFSVSPPVPSGFACASNISFSANFVTGNVIAGNINSVPFSVNFTTDQATTMAAIVAAVKAALPGIGGAINVSMPRSLSFYHLIGNGIALSALLTFTAVTVTGGASQPTVKLSPFRTATRVTNFGSAMRDAGDWDYHLTWSGAANEGVLAYYLCEYGYRKLPSGSRDIQFSGCPKASTLNPTLYANTDALGSAVHLAIYQFDAFRRTQKSDGRVYGGMGYAFVTASGDKGGGYDQTEPSQYSPYTPVLHAADPESQYNYCTSAAKIGQTLREAGFTTAGNAWVASAELAWNWAESLRLDYVANGPTGSVVDGYFNGTLGLQAIGVTSGGVFMTDTPTWNGQLATLFGTSLTQVRIMAAGTLYAATANKTAYGNVCQAVYTGTTVNQHGIGLWEFAQAPSAVDDYPTEAAYLNGRWGSAAVNTDAYWDSIHRAALMGAQNHDNQYYKWLQQRLNYAQGVNQEDRTRVTGMGRRYPENILLRDREAMGLPSSNTPGTVAFFHMGGQPSYRGLNNASTESPANYTVCTPVGADPNWRLRELTPFPVQMPHEEGFNDNTYAIAHTEFVIRTNLEHFISALICHAFDGNAATAPITSNYKRRLVCAA